MERRVKYGETTYPASWMDVLASFVGTEPLPVINGREERREEVIQAAVRLRSALLMEPSGHRARALNEAEDKLCEAVDIYTAWEANDVQAYGDGLP